MKQFPGRSLWKLKGSRSGDCTGGGGSGSSPGQSLFEEFDTRGPWCKNLRIHKEAVSQPQMHNMAGESSGACPEEGKKEQVGRLKENPIFFPWVPITFLILVICLLMQLKESSSFGVIIVWN